MSIEKSGPKRHKTTNAQRSNDVSEDDMGPELPMPSDDNDFEKQQQMPTKTSMLDEMQAKYDDVLRQNENQLTQIELPTKTFSELGDTVKSLKSVLATVFPAMDVGQHAAALTKPKEVLPDYPPLHDFVNPSNAGGAHK